MPGIRYVSFKNVVYNLGNGSQLKITPIPPGDTASYDGIIQFGLEKYVIETTGHLNPENLDKDTLENFDNYLSKHLEALRRLTWDT